MGSQNSLVKKKKITKQLKTTSYIKHLTQAEQYTEFRKQVQYMILKDIYKHCNLALFLGVNFEQEINLRFIIEIL